jgi:peptide/nickel transport system ATP-binding protein
MSTLHDLTATPGAMPMEALPSCEPLLAVRGLTVTFPATQGVAVQAAVRNLNLTLHAGRTLALVGESGCGKSTTALALMRLLPERVQINGRVIFEGVDLLAQPMAAMRRLRGNAMSMIFQEPMTSLNPVYTIGAQIAEALRLHQGLAKKAARQRAIELLDLVRITEPQRRIDDYPHQLSGGQRQRVMIAMAVSCNPRLLIADEPTTALDVTIQAQILELLERLRRELSMALLLITHDLGVVSQWAEEVVVMYGGDQVEAGAARAVLGSPHHPYTRGLLASSLHGSGKTHYTQGALPEIRVRTQSEFDAHTGAKKCGQIFDVVARAFVEPAAATEKPVATTPLLAVRELHCAYPAGHGVVKAVDNVSFAIKAGETLGLVGESGCGKSTLARTLLRLVRPVSGEIVLSGKNISQLPERALKPYRPQIQMVFQDPYASLNPRHTVFEMLDATLKVHGAGDRHERARRIGAMLDRVGLPANAAQRYPNEFSGGQRQRIGIARALILKPALVVCDEPVSALDVSIQAQILNLLIDLKHAFNLSYLFISHDLAVVRYMADQVMVMRAGQIVERGDPETIWRAPQHPYTRELLASVPQCVAPDV